MKKISKKTSSLIDFIDFTHQFRKVLRVARIPFDNRSENDAEHSYQLAMVAWFLVEQDKLKLNKERIFMYALAHDLVEIYAGDTYTFGSIQDQKSKKAREHKALLKIKKEFPHFKTLIQMIEKYEERKDRESKFIYALDKLLPPIQVYMEKGALWKEKGVTLKQVLENKNTKIKVSKEIDLYWQEISQILQANENTFFKM